MKIALRGGHNYQATGSVALLNEVTENRILTPIIIKYLKGLGHEVLDVTPGNCDANSDLSYGVTKANNWGADLFVSIHLNKAYASYNGAIGSEVCVYSYIEEAQRVCNKLEDLGFMNRGQKIRPELYELKYTTMKAMIIEVCFVEATKDVELYRRLGHDRIAKSIAEGIANKTIESDPTNELYRVRKSWTDAASQKGAYSIKENAIAECKKHSGYNVYDSKGNCVYSNCGSQPSQPEPTPPPETRKLDVFYKVFTAEDGWLPEVKNLTDYAGVFGHAIRGLMIRLSSGDVDYKVSTLRSNGYYPTVRNHEDYAGDLKNNVDKVQIFNNKLKYRVRLLNGRWLPWVIGTSDFAGLEGYSIDAIEIDSI